MRWTDAGEGFLVVLVHGIPTSPTLWRHVLSQVRGGGCLAFEMVGDGDSIPAGWDRDISVAGRPITCSLGWTSSASSERCWSASTWSVTRPGACQLDRLRLRADPQRPGAAGGDAADWAAAVPAFRALLASLVARGHDDPVMPTSAGRASGAYERHGGAAALEWQVRWLRTADTLPIGDRLRHRPG